MGDALDSGSSVLRDFRVQVPGSAFKIGWRLVTAILLIWCQMSTPKILRSVNNPLVKQMGKLAHGKERRKQNLCLLEGTHLIASAFGANLRLETVCCTTQWRSRHPQLWEEVLKRAVRVELVTGEVLKAIATTVSPDGVVATASRFPLELGAETDISLGLGLCRLQDPGNLGTIIRTAVATNVDHLWLSRDSVDLDNPKVLRASSGEWFRLSMSVSNDLKAVVRSCKARGVQVVATLPQAKLTYWEMDYTSPTVILLGNEGAGVSDELSYEADFQVSIPIAEGVESLNVAIAAALLLYEAQRQFLSTV